ncbi:MAG TPA: Atxe2 family lasso peptide isopeptidase [Allosphingosinicella sp.]|nr:Atxe2 family lasso peptide isopeptidase [Allosphingosinicella sp.]
MVRRTLSIVLVLLAVRAGQAVAAEAPTVRELVEVADIEALSVSPDGRTLAFRVKRASIEENSYRLDWHVADIGAGAVRRVAHGGAPIYTNGAIETEPAIWSSDGRFIHYRARIDDAVGLWRAAADGAGVRPVVQGDADVESVEPAEGGNALIFVTGPSRAEIARAERAEYDDGILVDASVDLAQQAFRGGWVRGRRSSERLIGRWFSRDELLWRSPRSRHRLDLATLVVSAAARADPAAVMPFRPGHVLPSPMATSAAGDVVEAVAGEDEAVRIEVRRAGGRSMICAAAACRTGRVVAIAWRPGHDEILFTVQDRNLRQTLRAWPVGSRHVRRVAGGDGLLSGSRSGSSSCAYTADHAICVAAGPASPPRLERIDLDGGGRSILLDPNQDLRRRSQPIVEQISLALPDGRRVTGSVMYGQARRAGPAPLFIHYYQCSGFLRGGGFGDRFPTLAMAGAGFVVACLNAVPNAEADGVGRFRDALASVELLVRHLADRGLVDSRRVGMGGFSFGSEATMWTAMNSDLLAAAAITSPQYEPGMYWLSSARGRDYAEPMRRYFGVGAPDEDVAGWRRLSPALNADRIRIPLLMQMPEQEARTTAELHTRLSNSATPVEMYLFPDEAHLVVQPRHMRAIYQRNLDWFRYWLAGGIDPDPAKASQYERWEALRRRRDASAAE